MKHLLLLTTIVATMLTSCHKAETTIDFNLTDLEEGSVIVIYKMDGNSGVCVYSDTITDGTFRHVYNCDSLTGANRYSIICNNWQLYSSRNLYVKANCESTVSGSGIYTNNWSFDSKNPRQQFDNKINDATKDILIELTKISAERNNNNLSQEERKVLSDKMDSLYTVGDEKRLLFLETSNVDEYWIEEFAKMTGEINYKGTESPNYPKLTELYQKLSDADKTTPTGKRITMDLFGKAPAIGDKVIDYDLFDINGDIHHLADYQGKWTLIDFSTYYCGPCRMFAPAVKYFYERGFNEKINIVTVTLDSQSQFKEMAETEKYISPLLNDHDGQNGIFALYKIPGYPTFYVVNPEGTITDSWFGLDMGRIIKTVKDNDAFPNATYQTENGTTTITNPNFADLNGGLLIDEIIISNDSTVLDCTFPMSGGYSINSSTALYINGKMVSKIIGSSIGFDGFAQIPFGEIGHCRLTFEPLPKNATEFDFIEGDCEGCFRVMGIKVKE